MADYPAELVRTRHLFDGSEVLIRPIRPEDAPMEQDFVQHLSADSRYRRFMSTLMELPPGKLRYLTEIDYVRHLALVAIIQRDGHEVEIGVARYVAGPSGTDCEFAIAIDDAWQGKGLGRQLMQSLIDVARGRGLTHMEGMVLARNTKMLGLMQRLGFSVRPDPDDASMVLVGREL